MKRIPNFLVLFCLSASLLTFMALVQPDKGYDKIDPFKNGWAKVYRGDKVGYINTKGEEVIACKYHYISDFVNGLAKVRIDKLYGYINKNDEVIIPIKYNYIGPFQNDLAQVKIGDQFGLINKQGEELTEIKYDEIGLFNKRGFAKVRINSLVGSIDTTGVEIIPVFKSSPVLEKD